MARSKIGTRGTNPGPPKTSVPGSRNPGNLGRKTSVKTSGGPNHDAEKAITRRPVNQGPGGHQRP